MRESLMAHLERNMVPLYLTDQEKAQLDHYADMLGISRQKILEAIIECSLEDMDTMDKIDFLVSEVRLIDQIKMYKNLSRDDVNQKAKSKIENDD